MLNPNLTSFMTIAECGSITKAAQQLFISPTSVMKQLNSFEDKLGIKLVERTSRGIRLTPAGQYIYDEGRRLEKETCEIISKAQSMQEASDRKQVIHIGTSSLYPATILTDIWSQAGLLFYHDAKKYKIELVQIHDSVEDVFPLLGRSVDIIIRLYDSKKIRYNLGIQPLGVCHFNCAVPVDSPLAHKDRLSVTDFIGYKVIVYDRKDSPISNRLATNLEKIPGIHIDEAPFFNLALFNRCSSDKSVLLVNSLWKQLHPSLVIKEVDWDYTVPYGMLFSRSCSCEVLDFIHLIGRVQTSMNPSC